MFKARLAALILLASCTSPPSRPLELTAQPEADGLTIIMTGEGFTECTWTLNREYKYLARQDIIRDVGFMPWSGFMDGQGRRFRPHFEAPEQILVECYAPQYGFKRIYF